MSVDYAGRVGAAERDLKHALAHLERASQCKSRDDRGQHLGWAIATAEAAVRALKEADPLHTVAHKTAGPVRAS